jgi:hypothetical protein
MEKAVHIGPGMYIRRNKEKNMLNIYQLEDGGN